MIPVMYINLKNGSSKLNDSFLRQTSCFHHLSWIFHVCVTKHGSHRFFQPMGCAPRSTLFTVYCRFKGKVRILLFFVYLFVCFIEICYSKHLNTVHKRKKSLILNTLHVANCTTAAFWNEELEEVFQDEKDGPCLKLDCRKNNIL